MTTNTEAQQASVRAVTGTTYDYVGDWSALFDLRSIAAGPFDQRLLEWINDELGEAYDNLPAAMNAFAVYNGVDNWNSLGTFSATSAYFILLETGDEILLEDGVYKLLME